MSEPSAPGSPAPQEGDRSQEERITPLVSRREFLLTVPGRAGGVDTRSTAE